MTKKRTGYKAGDLVLLKSGGPVMTVKGNAPFADLGVLCQWFVNGKLNEGTFDPNSLRWATEDDLEYLS